MGDFPPMNNFLLEQYPHNFILEIFIDFGMIIGSASIIAIVYLIVLNLRISVWMLQYLLRCRLVGQFIIQRYFFNIVFVTIQY